MKRFFVSLFLFPVSVLAQTTSKVPPVIMPVGESGKSLLPGGAAADGKGIGFVQNEFAPALTSGYLQVVLAIAIFMLVVAGAMYLLSDGNEEMVGKAKTTVLWTLLGVIAAILSYALIAFIANINFSA